MDLDKLFPRDLYQSYVIEGEPEITGARLLNFLEIRGEIKSQSPDLIFQSYESFTIDDSSQIKNWHNKKSVTEDKKICIIATKFINREAEQTLLKIIEEPAINSHFFIIVPDASILLDTILSRVHVVKIKKDIDNNIEKQNILDFIKISPKDRIDKIAEIIKENKSEEGSGQLRFFAIEFINSLEDIFYQRFKKDKKNKEIKFILQELQKARGYLSTPGASVKMILEHLALVI